MPGPHRYLVQKDGRPLVVFVTYTGIGDLLMALPLFGALRSKFQVLPLIPSLHTELARLLREDELLEDFLPAKRSLVFYRNPLEHILACWALSRLQPDIVAIYGKLVMAYGARVGLLRAGRVLFCHPGGIAPRPTSTLEVVPTTGNQTRDYLQFAEKLKVPLTTNRAFLTEASKSRLEREARALIGYSSYAVVAPWASDPRKEAPPRFFRECIEIIVTEGRLPVVVTGLPRNRSAGLSLLRGFSDKWVANLVGATTIPQAVGLLAGARFLLTNDGGTLHLARLVGTPAIAAFGPTAPEQLLHDPARGIVTLRLGLSCSPCANTPFHYRCPEAYLKCLRELEAPAARDLLLAACRSAADRVS
ncbi:MAG: glycosyltransferase family 9 protein [Candidatus Methylomirabilaceae bacterium]